MVGLFSNAMSSLGFGFSNNFKHILRWILLTIILCIPILNFMAIGIFLKVYRNEETDFSHAGRAWLQGLGLFVITLIYSIIVIIIGAILSAATGLGFGNLGAFISGNDSVALSTAAIAALVVLILLEIFFALFMVPATINFARTGKFGAAFHFSEIFGMIKKLGWGKYILAWIVIIIVSVILAIIIGLVIGILNIIPVVGTIIAVIITLLLIPIITMFELKYFGTLFE